MELRTLLDCERVEEDRDCARRPGGSCIGDSLGLFRHGEDPETLESSSTSCKPKGKRQRRKAAPAEEDKLLAKMWEELSAIKTVLAEVN
ncbi:hypothetical protein HPP92_011834 [Vanilla planifolia]|uniref:Uncharacterized protein n=1 Tax=Vanilla planifolia TaxID=51239 RepID=A0A835R1E6_VANPL|nr:hypothetical protein HPP92_011834 [Vanilla planifolia]